jgi:hypothetical protein
MAYIPICTLIYSKKKEQNSTTYHIVHIFLFLYMYYVSLIVVGKIVYLTVFVFLVSLEHKYVLF